MDANSMFEPALEALEEIAKQASLSGNHPAQRGGKGFRFNLSPNLSHTHVVRSLKPVPTPQSSASVEPAKAPGAPSTHVTSYSELISAIASRIAALGIRQIDFDTLAGFPVGLTGKAFGPSQVKRLGPEKMFDALRAASLKITVEADPEQFERMRPHIAAHCIPRQALQARPANGSNISDKMINMALSHLVNRNGGIRRLRDAVKEAQSAIGRRNGAVRLQKQNKEVAA